MPIFSVSRFWIIFFRGGDLVKSLRHVYLIMKLATKDFFKAINNLRKVKIWKKFEFSVFDGFLGQWVLQYELSSVCESSVLRIRVPHSRSDPKIVKIVSF